VALLIIAAFVFSRPGAMNLKPENPSPQVPATSKGQPAEPPKQTSASAPDDFSPVALAIRYSIKTFFPVEVPLTGRWEASDKRLIGPFRVSDFAALLKLAGWILVPLGVAGLTGLLRVKTSSAGSG
jgi:hypothetical protein